jgi:hypothetical protein
MRSTSLRCLAAGIALVLAQSATAGTDVFFNPLTQSTAVSTANSVNEKSTPWQMPAGLGWKNLTSMSEAETTLGNSIVRAPGQGTSAAMFDMADFSEDGKYVFIPHETPCGAGASRYDVVADKVEVIFRGDNGGCATPANWTNDYAAFDPATYTPNGTLLLGEEWAGQGRLIEILNPKAPVADIQARELTNIPNVAHEGLRFSKDGSALYFVDENNSGSVYKIVFRNRRDYTVGQVFVLKVAAYAGLASANWNAAANVRTGDATWVPLTDANGVALTTADPFNNAAGSAAGRAAADEVGGTPFGRPEDMEIGRLANGNEVMYFTATSEQAVYGVEMLRNGTSRVFVAADANTPRNVGHAPTTGTLNDPDNLAQDALGNIYIIEDKPNSDTVGGDIWFLRDTDTNGVAESLDHFMSNQVNGSESTGMVFNPADPTKFTVHVQHPTSTGTPGQQGDALWQFDLSTIVPPTCAGRAEKPTCAKREDFRFVEMLKRARRR